jgi:hypothetical protein
MFIQNVLHTPDVGQIIRCFAKAIAMKIKRNALVTDKVILPAFEEKTYCSVRRSLYFVSRYGAALEFLSTLFSSRRLPAECGVVAVAYIDRLLAATKLTFHDGNWRIIAFTAVLLANKVWAEHAVWNEDFVNVFSDGWLTINAIYRIEREFLRQIFFDLNIKPSIYTKYYFELRSYGNYTGDLPFRPMDKTTALKLAARSQRRSNELTLKDKLAQKKTGEMFKCGIVSIETVAEERFV